MKKKKIWIAAGIITVIAGLFVINFFVHAKDKTYTVEITSLQQETMSETVITQGTLNLSEEQVIYFEPEKGKIAEILVAEGDEVEAGMELIRYANEQLLLEQKQNELSQQMTRLQIENIKKQHKKIDDLLKELKDDEALQEQHDQISLQEKQLNLELEQLQLQKELIDQRINDLTITSEIDGKVIEVNDTGGTAQHGEFARPLMRIGTVNRFLVEGTVSEYDVLKLAVGQKVTLSADTVPGQTWQGEVKRISYLPAETDYSSDFTGNAGTVQYTVTVEVLDQNLKLQPGFNMIMEILTAEYLASTLPIDCVIQEGDIHYVYTVNEQGIAEKKEVEVGTATFETIEIKSGLENDEKVIISPPDGLREGMEVIVQ